MPKIESKRPKLVNRGPAGLLKKIKKDVEEQAEVADDLFEKAPKNRVAPGLKPMLVDIKSLVPDPVNARLHPERNLDAIMRSLATYGQLKPLVVQKKSNDGKVRNKVVAGNGTMEAAIALGWTKISANIMDMKDIDAAGYGLADNRSAELARWDFEVVARLDLVLQENGHPQIGWSLDELMGLRQGDDWVEPTWEDHWKGMPGFEQDDLTKWKSLMVHFRNAEDMQAFLELIGQNDDDISKGGIWYPRSEVLDTSSMKYSSKDNDAGDEEVEES